MLLDIIGFTALTIVAAAVVTFIFEVGIPQPVEIENEEENS